MTWSLKMLARNKIYNTIQQKYNSNMPNKSGTIKIYPNYSAKKVKTSIFLVPRSWNLLLTSNCIVSFDLKFCHINLEYTMSGSSTYYYCNVIRHQQNTVFSTILAVYFPKTSQFLSSCFLCIVIFRYTVA